MLKYFLKKLLICLLSLFIIMSFTFFLMKALPGDPFLSYQNIPEEVLKHLYDHYGLNKPLISQYFKYLKGFLTFDLGPSLVYENLTVNQIIKKGLPVSLSLGLFSFLIAISFGSILGLLAALKQNKWQNTLFNLITITGISIPNFLFAATLQYFLCSRLHIFPIAHLSSFLHMILPSISLAILPTAYIAKLMKASALDVLSKDYIKTARAKGLSSFQITTKHILKNAFFPIISYLGPLLAHVLTGSFIIEKIFSIPGLGQWLINSIASRDYPLILGLSVFFGFILITIIFLIDIIYGLIDPRIKSGTRRKY